jgi:hypothetical protein
MSAALAIALAVLAATSPDDTSAMPVEPDTDPDELFAFLRKAPQTDERRAWAQLYLGRALVERGYTHAGAVFFAQIAGERTNPEVLAPALEELRTLAAAPHDELMIDEMVFGTLDVAFLPDSTRGYAHYQQGLIDLRSGRDKWAHAHFSRIPDDAAEAGLARWAVLVRYLKKNKEPSNKLIQGFAKLAADEHAPAQTRVEAQLAVARLLYEKQDFTAALEAYQAVKLPPRDAWQPALYLEEAWTRFQLRDFEGAMGLLTTLDAPAFREEFLPDKHLLRAMIFRAVCHYLPAKRAAGEINLRYAVSLTAISERRDLTADPGLRRSALSRGTAQRAEAFLTTLESELERLPRHERSFGEDLYSHLVSLYGRALAEATRIRNDRLREAVEVEADRLLDASEQVRLIDYEVGLQLYARIQKNNGPVPPEEEALGPDAVKYGFRGEYWTDELRSYQFKLKNRCEEKP